MAQPFLITQGQTSPSAADVITTNARLFDLTDCTVAFSMRAIGSSALTVDHSAAVIIGDPTQGAVRYNWITGDTATAGAFSGWWTVTLPSAKTQDTPEFEVEVASHSPAGPYALATVEELINHLRLGNQVRKVTEDDHQQLQALILAASATCEQVTNHRFTVEIGVTHTFRYDGDVVLDLAPYDLRTITTLTIDTDVAPLPLDQYQYRLEPRNRPHGVYTHMDLQPYMPGGGSGINFWSGGANGYVGVGSRAFGREVQITGDWGWTTIPASLKHGVLVLAARWFNNPMGAQIIESAAVKMQFTRGSSRGGNATAGDDLPGDVESAWRPFVRPGF